MARIHCAHETMNMTVVIRHRIAGPVAVVGTIETDKAIAMRILAECATCGYRYDFPSERGWDRCPPWLLQRVAILAVESCDLRLAMRALNFPLKPAY